MRLLVPVLLVHEVEGRVAQAAVDLPLHPVDVVVLEQVQRVEHVLPSLQLQVVGERLRIGLDGAHFSAHAAEDGHPVAFARPGSLEAQEHVAVLVPHVEVLVARDGVHRKVHLVVLQRNPP